jgi:FkbM family methyltransferase
MSYSQNQEDIKLWKYIEDNNIDLPHVFVDIGALDGIVNSNAKYFQNMGWFVSYVEPNPESYAKLLTNVGKFLTAQTLNCAISDVEGSIKFNQCVSNSNFGRSGISNKNFDKSSLLKYKEIYVESITVQTLIGRLAKREIGILNIDVEGLEENILTQLFITKYRPKFIISEHQNIVTRENTQYDILSKMSYYFIMKCGCNTIWEYKGN